MRLLTKRRTNTFSRALLALAVPAGLLAVTPIGATAEASVTYEVTFTNLTDGQPMTPPVVVIHDDSVQLAAPGTYAGPEIEAIAEGGDNSLLVGALGTRDGVADFGVAGMAPFGPGQSVTITLTTDDESDLLSSVNMLVCANDGITGVDAIELPAEGTTTAVLAHAYDAGTERNTSRSGDVPGAPPCQSLRSGGASDQDALAQHKKIKGHSGVHNADALDFFKHDDVLRVTVTRIETEVV